MSKKICAHIPKKKAQEIKQYLQANDLIDKTVSPQTTPTELLYAVTKKFRKFQLKFTQKEFVEKKAKNIKELLEQKIPESVRNSLKNAYDRIGTIAILEIDEKQRPYQTQIAQAVLVAHPSIKTVLRKDGEHSGEFRTQKMKYLAGVNTTITTHIESGVLVQVDVQEVYFSPRLSSERLRIAQLIKPNEKVLVLFSGCAPYVCVLAKKSQAQQIDGVELNPVGHEFGLKNIQLNHIQNATLYNQDAKQFTPIPKINKGYDRILMPLPKTAGEFLEHTLQVIQKNSHGFWLHFYDFLHEDKFEQAVEKIQTSSKKVGFELSQVSIHTCGCQGIRTYRICVDAYLKKQN
jgi:tRNA (guanine37-N1)-methyltransferase